MTMYVNPVSQPTEEQRIAAQVQAERRRAARMKRKFITQATPWAPGYRSVPFEVILEDISDTGVGLIHDREMPIGVPHLLSVPRGDNNQTIIREFIVVRCDPRGDGKFSIGMDLRNPADPDKVQPRRLTSSRLKLLFLLFGIFGLLIAAFAPL